MAGTGSNIIIYQIMLRMAVIETKIIFNVRFMNTINFALWVDLSILWGILSKGQG